MGCCKTFFVVLGCIILMFFIVPIKYNPNTPTEESIKFENYLKNFNKSYTNETVYRQRFQAFKKSLVAIDYLNSKRINNLSARYGLTQYSDMTADEFTDRHLQIDLKQRILERRLKDSSEDKSNESKKHTRSIVDLPVRIDWRSKGVVTDVNNQKFCGACWAFSVIQNMETMNALKTKKLQRLSVQEVIDCAAYNDGCNGGDMCSLLLWMRSYHIKVQKEEEYPLLLENQQCKLNKSSSGVQIYKYACEYLVDNEDYILSALSTIGTVSVAINALSWQNYLGGVIQFHCDGSPNYLNHAVQIVGYDKSAEIPHYIVRNSWGKDFGDEGYLYVAIGRNVCGLANEVSILTVE